MHSLSLPPLRRSKVWLLLLVLLFSLPAVVQSGQSAPPSEEYMQIVLQVHDPAQPDFGQGCVACHGSIYEESFVVFKYETEQGTRVELDNNHHRLHRYLLDYGDNCTVCHDRLQAEQQDDGVIVTSFVDKFMCAGCHSTFGPMGIMEREYYETSGCPGCHGAAWIDAHNIVEERELNTHMAFIKENYIDESVEGCLVCHGDNPYIVPSEIEEEYWEGRHFPQ